MNGPYAAGAFTYFGAGWDPVPLRGKVLLARGVTGSFEPPSEARLAELVAEYPDANVGLRVPDGVIGIDVDCHDGKQGAETLKKAVAEWGPLPPTWSSTSRDDGSRILFFRVPQGRKWRSVLPQGGGVEIVQHTHRYAVVFPSIHPDTGKQYRWYRTDGALAAADEAPELPELAELPETWVTELAEGDRPEYGAVASLPDSEVSAWVAALGDGPMCSNAASRLGRHVAEIAEADRNGGVHPETYRAVMSAVRDAAEGHPGLRQRLDALRAAYLAVPRKAGLEKKFSDMVSDAVAKIVSEDVPVGGEDPCSAYGEEWAPKLDTSEGQEDLTAARWHDFTALIEGSRKRAQPAYARRTDGTALLYPGKEHTIYGETEAGKGMFLAMAVAECLAHRVPVVVIDFEEGDELEWGTRLLALGCDPATLNERKWFRYATPASAKEADANVADALNDMQARVVIFEGVSAAYGLYGWQIKENDSATAFRAHLVKPCLARGVATVASDHVTKSKEGRGRYSIGGVMKLNMVSGAAYLLELKTPITRGAVGTASVYCTKDRPGSVKPECAPTKDPAVRYAGTLRVDSTTPDRLTIEVLPPRAEALNEAPNDEDAARQGAVFLAVQSRGSVTGLEALRAAVKADGHAMHKQTVSEVAADLVETGRLVVRKAGGRGAQTWSVAG